MHELQDLLFEAAVEHCETEDDTEAAVAWTVLKSLERNEPDVDAPENVTVGYGNDRSTHDMWNDSDQYDTDGWWDRFPPVDGYRYRVFYDPDAPTADDGYPPERADRLMAAIGATPAGVTENDPSSIDGRDRHVAHYVLPENAPFVLAVESKANEVWDRHE
jgi:hypothetical protein